MKARHSLTAVVTCILIAATAACGGGSGSGKPAATGNAASAPNPVPLDQLVAQSHNENQLIVYGNAPGPYFKPVVDAFNKLYPWIKVQDTDMTDNEAFSRYQSEHA